MKEKLQLTIEAETHQSIDHQDTGTSHQMGQVWFSWEEVDGDEKVQLEGLQLPAREEK